MTDYEKKIIDIQIRTQKRWTWFQNMTSRFRDVNSPTRRIIYELESIGVRRGKDEQRVLEYGFGHGNLIFWFRPPTQICGIELSELAIIASHKFCP